MSYLVPRSAFPFGGLSSFFDEDNWGIMSNMPNGISLAEDDKHVYIEVALPGVSSKDVDLTFEKGVLRVVAERKEEEKEGKKYFRQATRSFSYQVTVPGEIDLNAEPEAALRDGVMKVTFMKSPKVQPKKIAVK
jgi:HSP20 family protein